MTSVAILGAGMMGSALAVPLADNGHDVRLVGTHLDTEIIESMQARSYHPRLEQDMPDSIRSFQLPDAAQAFDGAEIVLSGVVSYATHWAAEQLGKLLHDDQLLIMVAKGMESDDHGNLRILPDVLAADLPAPLREAVPISAIIGPCIAGELAARRQSSVIFTGRDQAVLDRLADTFHAPYYHVWTSTDIIGGEVCAALKNCYALGTGFAEGILEGEDVDPDYRWRNFNYEAALLAQGVVESRRLVEVLGGDPRTAEGLATAGDCYVTAKGGRNVKVGQLIGQGIAFREAWEQLDKSTLEGAEAIREIGGALPKLTERGAIGPDELPCLRHLYEVVVEQKPLAMPWERFFGGPGTYRAI